MVPCRILLNSGMTPMPSGSMRMSSSSEPEPLVGFTVPTMPRHAPYAIFDLHRLIYPPMDNRGNLRRAEADGGNTWHKDAPGAGGARGKRRSLRGWPRYRAQPKRRRFLQGQNGLGRDRV